MEAPISASQGAMRSLPGKLESVLSDKENGLQKGEKNKIRDLKSDLEELIDKYLVEPSEVEDPALTASSWMKEVRELSYDIHDFLDELVNVDADAKIQQAPRPKISRFQVFQEKRKRYQEITDQISSFRNRVKEAIQLHKNHLCKLKKWPSSSASTLDGRLLPPLEGGLRLIGMDSSIEVLSGWLVRDGKPEHKVVSILGVGGVGKTTLAKELYIKLGGQFQCRAFLRTTRKPDHRKLLISILSQVRPHQPVDAWGVPNLVEKIKEYLQNKTYFIIIDDLWAPSTWDIVSRALPKGNYCTRVLTTTEVEVVARICCAGNSKYIFKKKPLSDEESKELFSSIIHVHQSDLCPKDLSEVHKEVLKDIGGLPLAIIIMASLLARQPASIEQWNYIMSLPKSYLMNNANLEMMKHVLNLCYNSIPHDLKACMLYLSLYEEGSIILKDDLVKQWISEGFICGIEGYNKEKVARSYFDEFVNRGIIQPVDIDSSDEVMSCTVHYMVLHLIRCLSIEENFITAIDHFQTSTRLADKVRRLALHFGTEEDAKPPTSMRLSQVRSLAFFGSARCMPSVMQFRLLRVLILKLWVDPDEASYCNLSGISELFRLRYLRIDACQVNVELPMHMQLLKDLVALQIEARVTAVPSDIVNMLGLLHLSLPSDALLPTGIGNMTSLRTLGYFDLSSNSEENVLDLGKLTNLQDLHLTCSTVKPPYNLKESMEYLGLILEKLSNLKCVTLVPASSSHVNTHDETGSSSISISCDVLSSISPASAYLQRFELFPRFCIFHNLPKWFGELHQLCILKIAVREISTEDIRILKALPALTALSLSVWSVPEGWIFIEEDAFPALRYFKFTCAAPCLAFVEGAMSDVQRLKLRFNANRLEQYNPADAGFKHLSALKEISVEIGGAGADKSDLWAAESTLLTAFKKHRSTLIINLQWVHLIYHGDKEMNTPLQKKNYQTLPVKGVITDEQHGRIDKQVDSRTSMPLEPISHPQDPGRRCKIDNNMDIKLHLLESSTNNFSDELKVGSGGYGDVYKGVYNGEEIAVKKLHQLQGLDDSAFDNEFRNLSKVNHQNVVRLLGYCYESRYKYIPYNGELIRAKTIERILCFEYMHGGSLDKHIKAESCDLDWPTCYEIIKGTSEGLNHLHSGQNKPIYHLDLKPANVLLDKNMMAKIGDLGLSRLIASTKIHKTEMINVKGTLGYMPPEYIDSGFISKKFDVFSLGVIILKIMAGNNGYYRCFGMSPEKFTNYVIEKWERKLQGTSMYSSHENDILQVKKCVEIALRCVERDRNKRPYIKDIVHELQELEAKTEQMLLYSNLSKDRIGQTGSDSKVLAVDPTELRFLFEPRRDISTCLLLTNKTDGFIAFHVKTNQTKYCAQPNEGFMQPCSNRYISVTLRAQDVAPPNMQCNDMFLVQSAHVSEDLTSLGVIEDFFEEVMAGKVLDIVKLPIVYVASDRF